MINYENYTPEDYSGKIEWISQEGQEVFNIIQDLINDDIIWDMTIFIRKILEQNYIHSDEEEAIYTSIDDKNHRKAFKDMIKKIPQLTPDEHNEIYNNLFKEPEEGYSKEELEQYYSPRIEEVAEWTEEMIWKTIL